MRRSSLVLLIGSALLLACDVAPPDDNLTPIDIESVAPTPTDGAVVCDTSDVWARPADGMDPVHRTEPLVVHHPRAADVGLSVYGPKGRVAGDLWLDDDRAVFLPWQPWEADAHITWVLDVCGHRTSGGFTTGSVLRPPTTEELQERFIDVPYSVDLRVAEWTYPEPRGAAAEDPKAMSRVAYRFGPSFLLMVTFADDERLSLRVAPAVAESNGIYVQDSCREAWDVTLDRGDGAYLSLTFSALAAQADGQPVVMREVIATLGLGRDGFTDGRLTGELDLRDYTGADERSGCDVFGTLTGHGCVPCSTDHEAACAPFEVRGLNGLESDVIPTSTPVGR